MITKWNFSQKEFMCKCGCGTANVDFRLVYYLQKFRDWLSVQLKKDTPIKITSGCRCPAHNKKVGGSPKSFHLADNEMPSKAVDISVCSLSSEALMILVESFDYKGTLFKGKGLYPGQHFVHVDVRSGPAAKWVRDKDGYHNANSFDNYLK